MASASTLFITATLAASCLASAIPTSRLTFKDRLETKLSVNSTAPRCVPSFGNETLYNIFARGNDSAVWEWIPNFYSGDDSSGGTVFVSGTDSPEDGAYRFLATALPSANSSSTSSPLSARSSDSTTLTVAYRLNLADKPTGQHCLFAVTCSSCSDPSAAACRIRATVPAISSGYCTGWARAATTVPGVPGYGPVLLRPCKEGGSKGQEWDIKPVQ
ncbi:hypothetical protein JCM3766R1_001054 [Sporobolomyces carnicolor]